MAKFLPYVGPSGGVWEGLRGPSRSRGGGRAYNRRVQPPTVQYAATSDGFQVAYAVAGEGEPFVLTPPSLHHVRLGWRWRPYGDWLAALAGRYRLILFDARGQGMSTRGLGPGFAVADYERDLEAVVDALRLRRFVLAGTERFGHVALRYADAHPDRVRALVLMATAVSMQAWPLSHILGVGRENWDLLLWNNVPRGLPAAEARQRLEDYRRSVDQADLLRWWQACADSDVSDLLPRVKVPVLVLHGQEYLDLSADEAMKLGAAIPNAEVALLEGAGGSLHGSANEALAAIAGFLDGLGKGAIAPAARTAAPDLSPREAEVLRLLAVGRSNQQIADSLVISLNTVKRHVNSVYAKIGAAGRAEAIAYAHEHGLT